MPSRSGTLPCIAYPPLSSPASSALSRIITGPRCLKPTGGVEHGYAVTLAELVYHAGHGDGAHNGAAPVEDFQVVEAEQGKRFERSQEPAVLVDHAEAVGVAIRCQSHVRAGRGHECQQAGKIVSQRLRLREAGKGRVELTVDLGDPRRAARKQLVEVSRARAEHGVDHYDEAGVPDALQVHE